MTNEKAIEDLTLIGTKFILGGLKRLRKQKNPFLGHCNYCGHKIILPKTVRTYTLDKTTDIWICDPCIDKLVLGSGHPNKSDLA